MRVEGVLCGIAQLIISYTKNGFFFKEKETHAPSTVHHPSQVPHTHAEPIYILKAMNFSLFTLSSIRQRSSPAPHNSRWGGMQSKNVMILFAWLTICDCCCLFDLLFVCESVFLDLLFLGLLCAIWSHRHLRDPEFSLKQAKIPFQRYRNRNRFVFINVKLHSQNAIFAHWFHVSKMIVRWYYLYILLDST